MGATAQTYTPPANGIFYATYTIGSHTSLPSNIIHYTTYSIEDLATAKTGLIVFPNPFTNETNFVYVLIEARAVRLSIFDITGREIAVLEDAKKQQGEYHIKYNADNLKAGIYYYRLTSGNEALTGKLILTR